MADKNKGFREPRNHFEKIIILAERIKLLKDRISNSELAEIDIFDKALKELAEGQILVKESKPEEKEETPKK